MENDNKQIIIENIWQNPAPVLGGEWTLRGKAWQTQRGAIRLLRSASGANITVYFNHGTGKGGETTDVFTYIQENTLHTSDFWETLKYCAERYGVDLTLSKEQTEKIQRQRLAREVAPSLIASLSENPQGETAKYLRDCRGMEPDNIHFGELTAQSIARAKEALKAKGYEYDPADFEALKLTPEQAAKGYNLVLPYYRNGVVVGFLFRDITGKAAHKYDTPQGMKRGYCDRLSHGEPAYIVEGEIDALRLTMAGFTNVIAMGGAGMSEELTRLLETHAIRQITYIPYLEYNEQGERKTKLLNDAIRAFQGANVDGQRVITHLYIAEFPTPEGATLSNLKIDADTYGKEQGADALRNVAATATEWWDYELAGLDSWATDTLSKGETLSRWEFERRFRDIYDRCATPIERERIRQNIKGANLYEQCGITPAALLDVDEWNRQTEYNNRIKAGLQALSRAVDGGANPATVGDILATMSEAQSTDTRDEWDKQRAETFTDELRNIQEQPETLRTKWELGAMAPNKMGTGLEFHRYEYIEFYPADISVFCAPTSHGKTMILFQSAIDLVRNTDKTYLFVSCEENKRQLLERALNVYLDIPTEPGGRDNLNNYCFIPGTRKRAIKAAIRGGYAPEGYTPEHWENLSRRIMAGVERYGNEIRPRLILIHTEGTAQSITANVRRFVAQYEAQGVEIGGVFVDYMQLLTSDGNSFSRHDELKDVCKALKDCAARTELPVIIAAQLNRYSISEGIDNVTVANIGEGADIERIAHDIYMIWQVDKTKQDLYYKNQYPKGQDGKPDKTQEPTRVLDYDKMGDRSRRIFKKTGTNEIELKTGYLYIEQMKARDGKTDGWGLFPFNGEQGRIDAINTEIMGQ